MKQIPVGKGKFAIVDDADFEYLSECSWHCTRDGYPTTTDNFVWGGVASGTSYRMHKIITMTLFSGQGVQVDHINGNPLDNRSENLRVCTPLQNSKNRKVSKNNRVGISGIRFRNDKSCRGWIASIRIDGKSRSRVFKTQGEAVAWRLERERDAFGDFAPSVSRPKSFTAIP